MANKLRSKGSPRFDLCGNLRRSGGFKMVLVHRGRSVRKIFPFSKLPAEIRNIIYEMCFSFDGIETFFEDYYKRLKKSSNPRRTFPRLHLRTTPTILLLNREIYTEAIPLLEKKTIRFDHGLLDICSVTSPDGLITGNALRQVGTVIVSTKGHPVLERGICRMSWYGYLDLVCELGAIFAKGHNLKKLVLDFEDEALASHIACWKLENVCDFRNHLKEALNHLRKVRGVGYVEIKGVDEEFARELKAVMESKQRSFFDFPGEVRNMIYYFSGDYSDISTHYANTATGWNKDGGEDPEFVLTSTPTILLLNKQIYQEASSIIQSKPFNLTFPDDKKIVREAQVPNIMRLIHNDTVPRIQHLNITLNSWHWLCALQLFFPLFAGEHKLQTLSLHFQDEPFKKNFLANPRKFYPDRILHDALKPLATVRGVPKVTITGDLPAEYAGPLVEAMQSLTSNTALPAVMSIRGNGEVVDPEADQE